MFLSNSFSKHFFNTKLWYSLQDAYAIRSSPERSSGALCSPPCAGRSSLGRRGRRYSSPCSPPCAGRSSLGRRGRRSSSPCIPPYTGRSSRGRSRSSELPGRARRSGGSSGPAAVRPAPAEEPKLISLSGWVYVLLSAP